MNDCIQISSMVKHLPHKVPGAIITIAFSLFAVILNLTLIISFFATRQITQKHIKFTDILRESVQSDFGITYNATFCKRHDRCNTRKMHA